MARVYHLDSTDPWTNLAVEEHLFGNLGPDDQALLLWRNQPCVVIGRHQNPWAECDLVAMGNDEVPLVRRISGGGAVYHDLGNTNFTFMAAKNHYDIDLHYAVVLEALTGLGLPAERNDRNDLILGSRKISGSAFRHTSRASLHHGTLLIDADTTRLARYLSSNHQVSDSKGIASVRSDVVTLSSAVPGLRREAVWEAISHAYRERTGAGETKILASDTEMTTGECTASIPAIQERVNELREWEWRFGKTPRFTRQVTAADGELEVEVYHGRVVDIRSANNLATVLRDVRYVYDDLQLAAQGNPEYHDDIMRIAEGLI